MDSATRGVAEDGYVVDCFVEHLKWLGYSHVILKSDNENAILKLPHEIHKLENHCEGCCPWDADSPPG